MALQIGSALRRAYDSDIAYSFRQSPVVMGSRGGSASSVKP